MLSYRFKLVHLLAFFFLDQSHSDFFQCFAKCWKNRRRWSDREWGKNFSRLSRHRERIRGEMFALTFPLTLKKAILSFSVKNKMHLNRFNNSRDKKTKTASASGLASASSAARTSPSSSHSMPEPEFERNHSIFLTQLFHFFHFKLKKGLVF